MTISPGRTSAEIREFVQDYQLQPHGQKTSWLAGQGVSYERLRRWRDAVFEGDVDRGLVPREGTGMTVPAGKRTAIEQQRAAERAAHETELARLAARVAELEGVNDALGATGSTSGSGEARPTQTAVACGSRSPSRFAS